MAKVQIYGEIVSFQDEWIIENGFTNLSHINNQLKEANGEDLEVGINSLGGDVDAGFAIYSALRRYATENKAKITTKTEGSCCSSATIPFLAGDTRIVSQYIEPFIHNTWMFGQGDAEEFQKRSDELERANVRIAKFYSEHTNLTYDDARQLMDDESFLTPEEAINIRFATQIEEVMRPAALKKYSKAKKPTLKNKDMADKKTEKGLLDHLKAFFKNEGIKNLEVFTSTNETVLFSDLEEGQEPAVGDKAEIDGKAAEGRITLQDGTVYVFVAGILEEIIPVEEEEESGEEMEALKRENAELKAQLDTQAKKLDGVVAKQTAAEARWNKLSQTISNYQVDGKEDEEDKAPKANPSKRYTLADAAQALNNN